MKKVILFDLYDTLLKDIFFDFNRGLTFLYNNFFLNVCTQKELEDFAATFLPLYEKRKKDHTEICLIKDEIPYFFKKFGIKQPDSIMEIEYLIMNEIQNVTVLDEVRNTLRELQKNSIDMYILSNSIFTGFTAKKLLNDFGISHYFNEVFSSADYGIRKPCSTFYHCAIEKILKDNPEIGKSDILYIGNDYETDVIGANSVGLDTVWYNVKHLPNYMNLAIYDIDDIQQVLEIAQK